jgi:hypothetical protein
MQRNKRDRKRSQDHQLVCFLVSFSSVPFLSFPATDIAPTSMTRLTLYPPPLLLYLQLPCPCQRASEIALRPDRVRGEAGEGRMCRDGRLDYAIERGGMLVLRVASRNETRAWVNDGIGGCWWSGGGRRTREFSDTSDFDIHHLCMYSIVLRWNTEVRVIR